jgi:hypothetical protein
MVAFPLALTAVAGIRLAGAAPPAPPVFDVDVAASPVVVHAAVPSALPLAVDSGMARSSVAINSQPNAISQAAIVYLPLLEAAPALFGLPPAPSQALPYCYSYFPGDPREAACGGPAQNAGPFDVAGGSGKTVSTGDNADPTTLHSQSSVTAAGLHGTASLPAPVSMGSVASAASAGGDDNGRMAAGSSTSVSDLDVAGVLQIQSIRSEVTAAVGGVAGSAAHRESFTISGATVAGQPVTIDNDGVHVSGQTLGGDLLAAQKQVDQALAAAGVAVRTFAAAPPKVADDGTTAAVSSGGLVISLAPSGQASVELRLGVSQVTMSAYRDSAANAGPASGSEVTGSDSGGTLGGPEPAGASGTPAAESIGSPPPPPPPPSPGSGSGPPSSMHFHREVLASDLASASWHIPYPPFAALVLAGPLLLQARRFSFTRR